MGATESAITDVLHAVRELHSATEALFDAVAERYGINRNDLRCLEIIERDGPLGPGRLGGLSGFSPAAVTKILDRLEAAGYVVRRPSLTDRRAQVVEVAAGHNEWRRAVWQPVVTEASAVLGSLPDAELRGLAATLQRLAEVNRGQAEGLSEST
ncbi:MarR family winged helix-turn-helix transcriptional regulator [Qaidamihabitans albus]|uniref:MarR family winged helix-turn-helix transcriptional regulator n=1 Tax=Qaidamihabitans albus TaxID=2795733 RepID=UPI0018F23D9E|nr:MarR family transcriptional regulator [Qaidamihabitans albus]